MWFTAPLFSVLAQYFHENFVHSGSFCSYTSISNTQEVQKSPSRKSHAEICHYRRSKNPWGGVFWAKQHGAPRGACNSWKKAAKNLTGRASEVRTPKPREKNGFGDTSLATHLGVIVRFQLAFCFCIHVLSQTKSQNFQLPI